MFLLLPLRRLPLPLLAASSSPINEGSPQEKTYPSDRFFAAAKAAGFAVSRPLGLPSEIFEWSLKEVPRLQPDIIEVLEVVILTLGDEQIIVREGVGEYEDKRNPLHARF